MANIKTEHNGAKNGGGYWGTRKQAKKISKRLRRIFGKYEIERSRYELETSKGSVAKGWGREMESTSETPSKE